MDLNLNTLKREVLEYLESAGFAVFFSSPGGLEGQPLVLWDSEHHPGYQAFLEVARQADVKLVLFATREFEAGDLDEAISQLEECDLQRDAQREYESRLNELRAYDGVTCSLELAFDYRSRLYVYEVQPDWYEEFLEIEDEIVTRTGDDGDDVDDSSLGGYFSKN